MVLKRVEDDFGQTLFLGRLQYFPFIHGLCGRVKIWDPILTFFNRATFFLWMQFNRVFLIIKDAEDLMKEMYEILGYLKSSNIHIP